MEYKEIEERIQKLRKLVEYHRMMYYTFDDPEISDSAFDTLQKELEVLEKKYPEFMNGISPTQKVGDMPLKKFKKVNHTIPMLSLQDAFGREEILDWIGRLEGFLNYTAGTLLTSDYYCELKIDGLAIELIYHEGVLISASTRGDGLIGEDVTENIKTIQSIPQKLSQMGKFLVPKNLVVRGEIFLTKDELDRVNKEQTEKGLKPYANTRNLAAGSLRQLDPNVSRMRNLQSFQYDIVGDAEKNFGTHEDKHKALASWGFTVNTHNTIARGIEDVFRFWTTWEHTREKLPYEIDGLVIVINDNNIFNTLGTIGKTPRGSIAYKFTPKEATTRIIDIRIQVGRTGVLTPVADLIPVSVGGTTIAHATLHNADEIKRLGIKIGDTIVVSRAGDVIPKITAVLKELRTGKERSFIMPKNCPIDGSPVIVEGALHRCSHKLCGARHKEMIYHFVSRKAFDIRGLGAKIIDRFLDEGLIVDVADIFNLSFDEIKILDRFGEKSAENIINEINNKKSISQEKFLYALGMLHVGEETARVIGEHYPVSNIVELISQYPKIEKEEWEHLPDIGPKVSESIYAWFSEKKNIDLLKKMESFGVILHKTKKKQGKFLGKSFVITGVLEYMSREEVKAKIKTNGGNISETVSKNVSYIIVGKKPGSKLDRAKKLNIKIISENDFIHML